MSSIVRETKETTIRVELTREGPITVDTGVPFLDHMMTTLARYSGLGLNLHARGDLRHHVIEDVGIAVGLAMVEEFSGPIARYGHAVVPMEYARGQCAIDFGGRPYYRGPLPSSFYDHWMRSFADHAKCTLHQRVIRARDRHHAVEAGFKALGFALAQAFVPADRV